MIWASSSCMFPTVLQACIKNIYLESGNKIWKLCHSLEKKYMLLVFIGKLKAKQVMFSVVITGVCKIEEDCCMWRKYMRNSTGTSYGIQHNGLVWKLK